MDYKQKAEKLHKSGCNCAQSVVLSFADELKIDQDSLFRISEGLGAGMGGTKATCGAVSGACMVAGALCSQGTANVKTKGNSYQKSREIVNKFIAKNKSIICCELKKNPVDGKVVSCDQCISDAVDILVEVMNINN